MVLKEMADLYQTVIGVKWEVGTLFTHDPINSMIQSLIPHLFNILNFPDLPFSLQWDQRHH